MAQAEEQKGPLGLSVETVTPSVARDLKLSEPRGVVVREVRSGSPAEHAGIRAGDVITEVNHKAVADAVQMKQVLETHAKGAPVVVKITRTARASTWPWPRSAGRADVSTAGHGVGCRARPVLRDRGAALVFTPS